MYKTGILSKGGLHSAANQGLNLKKKAMEMLFMDTVNKAFFPLQLYISQTFITKPECLVPTCTKSLPPGFTWHRLSFKILMTTDENFHQKLFPAV